MQRQEMNALVFIVSDVVRGSAGGPVSAGPPGDVHGREAHGRLRARAWLRTKWASKVWETKAARQA